MKELYDSTDRVASYLEDMWQEDQSNKQELARLWERCAAFANGNQNFMGALAGNAQISGSSMIFSQYQDNRSQMMITNEIEPIMRALISYLTRTKPAPEVYPADQSEERKMKARVVERVLDAKYDLDNESQLAKKAAYYALTFGTAFRKDYWDNSIGRDAELPEYDQQGNEVIDPQTGQPIMRVRKTGDSTVAMLTPLSMSFDWSYSEWDQLPWIMESYLMGVDWIKEVYDRQEPGYTGKAASVVEGGAIGNSLSILEHLKYATPYTYGVSAKGNTKNKALVQEIYIAPCSDMPRGRMLVKAGGFVVYDSAIAGYGSPYFYPSRQVMWHPYNCFQYAPYVGRLLGKSLVESLIPQQMRLNEINGAIIFNANTLAKVDILAAENQLKRGIINGMGANVYTYNPRPDAPPPIKWPGVPLPAQFFQEKDKLIEQMVREAGANIGGAGQIPTGITAAAAIEMIFENTNAQQTDMIISWEKFHEIGFTKKARVIRQFNHLPNEDIVDYLRTISKDNLDLEMKAFVGEDMGDGWIIKIEAGSLIPKSEKAQRDTLAVFAEKGILGPVQEDSPRGARLRKELLSKFGLKGFDLEELADVEKAKWENDRMLGGLPVEVWEEDNDAIHISVLVSKMKDPKWLERATDEVKQLFDQHLAAHKQAQQQKQMASMPPPMPGAGGPPPPGAPPSPQGLEEALSAPTGEGQGAGTAPPQP